MGYSKFTILLSASVPSEKRSEKYLETYTKIKDAQKQIDEAVIGLARSTFENDGHLIFGGHPSISHLIAMVAPEFTVNRDAESSSRPEEREKLITLFQSRAFEDDLPNESEPLFNLGYSNIVWTEAVDGEKFDPNVKDKPQCENSLKLMRETMFRQKIDAFVCIGGMEGIEKEFELFREVHPTKPIYLFKTTGGASRILANEFGESETIRIPDKDFERTESDSNKGAFQEPQFQLIPYAFINARMIREIINRNNRN